MVILADPGEDEMVAVDVLVAPGEQAILDAHLVDGPRPVPRLAVRRLVVRPKTLAEKQFCRWVRSPRVFGELYRRGGEWKFRGVGGQGHASGLAGIARDYGVNV